MFQKLIFKPRGRSSKTCIKDTAKNKKQKKTQAETETEDPKNPDEKLDKEADNERINVAKATLKESTVSCTIGGKMDDGIEISAGTVKTTNGAEETKDTRGENSTEEGEEDMVLDEEGSKANREPLENGEVKDVLETVATVEMQTKEKEDKGAAESKAVLQHGLETDEEKAESEENRIKKGEPVGVKVVSTETVTDLQASSQNSEDTPE